MDPPNGTLYAFLGMLVFVFLSAWAFGLAEKDSRKQGPYFELAAGCATIFLFFAGIAVILFLILVHYAWGCLIWPWEPAICGAR